jgi:hypothetical protein
LTLRNFETCPVPLVSFSTTRFLKSRSLSTSIFRRAELDAPLARVLRFVEQLGDVQQRLRRMQPR